MIRELEQLFAAFGEAGRDLYLVGGCVRDLLRGKPPKDYDLSTPARPEEVKSILRSSGIRFVPIGEAFGTIAAVMGGQSFEITTYRVKESYTKGSRHPRVEFGDALFEDLGRRDLCINAMAMDGAGRVVDPFGGAADLEARVLRVPGGGLEKSREILRDDPLRILRVARFVASLGFSPVEELSQAATEEAVNILSVSRERWKAELERCLCGVHVRTAVEWLAQTRVLYYCLPELSGLASLSGSDFGYGSRAQNLFELTLDLLCALPARTELRWAALLHGSGLQASASWKGGLALGSLRAEEFARRLKLSNEERDVMVGLLSSLPLMAELREASLAADERELRVALRRLHDSHAAVSEQCWPLWEALSTLRGEECWVAGVAMVQQRLGREGALQFELPSGLGTLLSEHLGVSGTRLGALLGQIREAVISERWPSGASGAAYLELVRESRLLG